MIYRKSLRELFKMEYKESTKNAYNLNSEEYIKKYKKNSNFDKREEFSTFIKNLNGRKILDVGCGPGFHTEYFNSKGLDCLGIDNSKEMVKYAKKNKINVELMDMENLDFKNNTFDAIWCVSSLLHLPKKNIPEIINSFYELLSNKGTLYVSLKEGNKEEFDTKSRFFSYFEKNDFLDLFSKFEVLWILEKEIDGFNNIGVLFKK